MRNMYKAVWGIKYRSYVEKSSFFEGLKVSQKDVEGTEEVFHKKCRVLFIETRPNS